MNWRAVLLLTGSLAAQQPPTEPPPIDPVQAAAEAMRRAQAGETKPVTVPAVNSPPVEAAQDPKPPDPKPIDPAQAAAEAMQGRPPEAATVPQDPERPIDPTEAAARALEGGEPVEGAVEGADDPARAARDAAGAPVLAATPSPVVTAADLVPYAISGDFFRRFRYRRAEVNNNRDADILGILSLDVGDRTRDAVTGHFYGRGNFDLDGFQNDNVFNTVDDFASQPFSGWIYEAYVDFNDVPGADVLRLGRQTLWDTPVVLYLDGVLAETEELGDARIKVGAYIGAPVRLFYAHVSGEWLGGMYVESRPWQGGRLRADWFGVTDYRPPNPDFYRNALLGLAGWQTIADVGNLYGRLNWLDGNLRDLILRGDSYLASTDTTVRVSWTQLITTRVRSAIEVDPFWDSSFNEFPFYQLGVLVSQGLGETLVVDAGFDLRRLTDSADEGRFNRDYERVYGSLVFDHTFADWLVLSFDGDAWESSGEQTFGLGFEALFEPRAGTDFALGTYYARFDYDSFQQTEREDVQVFYGRFNQELDEALQLRVEYRYEDTDFDQFHVFETMLTWRF